MPPVLTPRMKAEIKAGLCDSNGLHVHSCTKCKTTWQHPEPPKGMNIDSSIMHSCPKCGREEYYKQNLKNIKGIDFPWEEGTEFPLQEKSKFEILIDEILGELE